jgi:hypothetical protein
MKFIHKPNIFNVPKYEKIHKCNRSKKSRRKKYSDSLCAPGLVQNTYVENLMEKYEKAGK